MDKNQKMRFSKAEVELVRNTFGENEDKLYALRNFFLQLPHAEIGEVSEEVVDILKKSLLPELNNDVPLLQQADIYFGLGKIKEMLPAVAFLHIKAKDILRNYIKERFLTFSTGTEGTIDLAFLKEEGNKDDEQRYIDMVAYLETISYIDQRFNELSILSKSKDETEEERKVREAKDSSK